MSSSIAFLKFQSTLFNETRTFWHTLASFEYADRWLKAHNPANLTSHPGDHRYPFRAINITPQEFFNEQAKVSSYLRANTLVSFITTFECFLAELLERVVYLEPTLVSDSELQVSAKEIAGVVSVQDMRKWFAAKIADKYLRNKTHAEMISKLDRFSKAGISARLKNEIEEWSLWALVRNSIVHTSRSVTEELSKAWPQRFPLADAPITLENNEVARVQHLAFTLAKALDERACFTVIKNHDSLLIARELFVQQGIENPSEIRSLLSRAIRKQPSKIEIEKTLADQRGGTIADKWELSSTDLSLILL